MHALLRSTRGKVLLGILLMVMPFALAFATPMLGAKRGLFSTLAGVLVGIAFERPFLPYNMTFKRWMGRAQWVEIAILSGVVLGMVISVADALGAGGELTPLMEQIWIPLYRAAMFATGLTLLRRAWWERSKSPRPRVFRGMPTPPVKPALPRAQSASEPRDEHRY